MPKKKNSEASTEQVIGTILLIVFSFIYLFLSNLWGWVNEHPLRTSGIIISIVVVFFLIYKFTNFNMLFWTRNRLREVWQKFFGVAGAEEPTQSVRAKINNGTISQARRDVNNYFNSEKAKTPADLYCVDDSAWFYQENVLKVNLVLGNSGDMKTTVYRSEYIGQDGKRYEPHEEEITVEPGVNKRYSRLFNLNNSLSNSQKIYELSANWKLCLTYGNKRELIIPIKIKSK